MSYASSQRLSEGMMQTSKNLHNRHQMKAKRNSIAGHYWKWTNTKHKTLFFFLNIIFFYWQLHFVKFLSCCTNHMCCNLNPVFYHLCECCFFLGFLRQNDLYILQLRPDTHMQTVEAQKALFIYFFNFFICSLFIFNLKMPFSSLPLWLLRAPSSCSRFPTFLQLSEHRLVS